MYKGTAVCIKEHINAVHEEQSTGALVQYIMQTDHIMDENIRFITSQEWLTARITREATEVKKT